MSGNKGAIVYFGSDDFSAVVLAGLLQAGHPVALAVTTPPQSAGRGLKQQLNPVALWCRNQSIPCVHPASLKETDAIALLQSHCDKVFVVVSYGKILPRSILDIPRYAVINLHPSLLPRWRGPSPIQSALRAGDTVTGVSVIALSEEIDGGDILAQKKVLIDTMINAADLEYELAQQGIGLLTQVIDASYGGKQERIVQDTAYATYAPKLIKEEGRIQWHAATMQVHNMIRALNPWPGAFTTLRGKLLKLYSSQPVREYESGGVPGEIIAINKEGFIRVATGDGAIDIGELQIEGRKRMNAYTFSLGVRLVTGEKLGE